MGNMGNDEQDESACGNKQLHEIPPVLKSDRRHFAVDDRVMEGSRGAVVGCVWRF
jgi:hypothetical protein